MDKREALFYFSIAWGSYVNRFDRVKGFEAKAVFENKDTDTQGAFGVANNRDFVIVFRGSEETGIHDWITDLKFIKQVYPYQESNNKKVKVHYGFIQAYQSVREAVLDRVKKAPNQRIVCTGHSLGAALACLCALDVQYNTHKSVRCFTYGCPKVGNSAFADSYNKRVPKTYRFVTQGDLVPKLPPFGYHHVGELHELDHPDEDLSLMDKVAAHLPQTYIKSLRA
ncbi:MAG: lipase family protein [Chloroflexota bacterium]